MKRVVHIGCEKTGTTSLQKYLFDQLPSVYYTGRYSGDYFTDLNRYIRADCEATEAREKWIEKLEAAPGNADTVLFSREGLTSTHISEQDEMAKRVHDVFGDADILLTIRAQQDISISRYFNNVARGYAERFDSHMERGLQTLDCDFSNDDLEHFRIPSPYDRDPADLWSVWQYDELIQAWRKQFRSVSILPLEAWSRNPDLVETEIAEVLGIDERDVDVPEKRARSRVTNYKPTFQRVVPGLSLLTDAVKSTDIVRSHIENRLTVELSDRQLEAFETHYGDTNRALSREYPFDLQALGYPG